MTQQTCSVSPVLAVLLHHYDLTYSIIIMHDDGIHASLYSYITMT